MVEDPLSEDRPAETPGSRPGSEAEPSTGRFAVLDVFGLKLEVSNPRLAELLTMDARQALSTDVRDLVPSADEGVESQPVPRAAQTPVVPDVVLSAPTPHDENEVRARREFRARVEADGEALGFSVSSDGLWRSPSGLAIVTRAIERPVSLASASHYVTEIAARRDALAGPDSTALFIVDSQQTADVFKVAIRQRRLYDLMRTISIDNLEQIRSFVERGTIDHNQAVVLLVPITNIDVGEVLSVIRCASPEE